MQNVSASVWEFFLKNARYIYIKKGETPDYNRRELLKHDPRAMERKERDLKCVLTEGLSALCAEPPDT